MCEPIDVLPVCLSPSISSLCPLPIGIIASKHSGPVCKGSNTDCLSIIPTAGDSITYWFLDDMLRVPNNCDPNGSNKDPTTKSPSITAAELSLGCNSIGPKVLIVLYWIPYVYANGYEYTVSILIHVA